MIDQAIEKINAEMQAAPSNINMERIGHYIIDRCMDSTAAAKVCVEGKTLKGAMEELVAEARKAVPKKHGAEVDVSMPPGDVFGIVDRYFGFPADLMAQMKACGFAVPGAASVRPAAAPPKPAARVDFDPADFF